MNRFKIQDSKTFIDQNHMIFYMDWYTGIGIETTVAFYACLLFYNRWYGDSY